MTEIKTNEISKKEELKNHQKCHEVLLTASDVEFIKDLYNAHYGLTHGKIGEVVSLSASTIYKAVNRIYKPRDYGNNFLDDNKRNEVLTIFSKNIIPLGYKKNTSKIEKDIVEKDVTLIKYLYQSLHVDKSILIDLTQLPANIIDDIIMGKYEANKKYCILEKPISNNEFQKIKNNKKDITDNNITIDKLLDLILQDKIISKFASYMSEECNNHYAINFIEHLKKVYGEKDTDISISKRIEKLNTELENKTESDSSCNLLDIRSFPDVVFEVKKIDEPKNFDNISISDFMKLLSENINKRRDYSTFLEDISYNYPTSENINIKVNRKQNCLTPDTINLYHILNNIYDESSLSYIEKVRVIEIESSEFGNVTLPPDTIKMTDDSINIDIDKRNPLFDNIILQIKADDIKSVTLMVTLSKLRFNKNYELSPYIKTPMPAIMLGYKAFMKINTLLRNISLGIQYGTIEKIPEYLKDICGNLKLRNLPKIIDEVYIPNGLFFGFKLQIGNKNDPCTHDGRYICYIKEIDN